VGFKLRKGLIFFLSFFLAIGLGRGLLNSLPGHYLLDETQIQGREEGLDWSRSWDHPEFSVASVLAQSMGYTLGLQMTSFFLVLFLSVFFPFASLQFPKTKKIWELFFVLGASAPALLWAPLLIYFFSLKLNLFPLRFEDHFLGWCLPLVSLTFRPLCLSAQLLLAELVKIEKKAFFLVARAKGLSRLQVFWKHGLKNAMIPYTSQAGNFLVQSLMGSVLVENLFSVPGAGHLFVKSLQNRDLPVVFGLIVFFTFIIMLVHILVEQIQVALEPRGKTEGLS
jgi:oligopeptide transport system permease protein